MIVRWSLLARNDLQALRDYVARENPAARVAQEAARVLATHFGDRFGRAMFEQRAYGMHHGLSVAGEAAIESQHTPRAEVGKLKDWLLAGESRQAVGPHQQAREAHQHQHRWWRVMCLTGVDYFSTLGYQPGIAALAAGALSPIATLILVLVTLFGALPMYRRVAADSPHGEGSIAMLEHLLSWWKGKLFVLCLLGFAATDFIITITLSAADGAAHALENPFMPASLHDQRIGLTLLLLALLAAIFLKGFTEAIGVAFVLVVAYLVLNLVVVAVSLLAVAQHPMVINNWWQQLLTEHGNPLAMVGVSLLLFPKLALGLSGFETGVAVMPLVQGDPHDSPAHPEGRIRNTRRLLMTAAVIMSVFLLTSSLVTITLIPPEAFQPGGKANGRALAYLAHQELGEWFGTGYDISTILILWFAGASAMAGLLNLVPRYLPRYGMAPEWARAARPLVLVFTAVALAVTLIFRADVDAQGGAYATGVLVLMASAAIAVTLSVRRQGKRALTVAFAVIVVVFVYTTILNVIERPDGVKIATFFICVIIVVSLASRIWRVTELRAEQVELDLQATRFVTEAASDGRLRIISHDPDELSRAEYVAKEEQHRACDRIPAEDPLIFLEVRVRDASEFASVLRVRGEEVSGYRVLRTESSAIPNAIAALLLHLRDTTGIVPHVYFSWSEGKPLQQVLRYLLFGTGDVAPVAHEVLRAAEPDLHRRPVVHVA